MLTILASYAQEESLSASENQKWRIKKNLELGAVFLRASQRLVSIHPAVEPAGVVLDEVAVIADLGRDTIMTKKYGLSLDSIFRTIA